jgi:hypothetical protein
VRTSTLSAAENLVDAARYAVDRGDLERAIALANAGLTRVDRLRWPVAASRRRSLLVVRAHDVLQNTFREVPGEHWRSVRHLSAAMTLARDLSLSRQYLTHLFMERVAVCWAGGDIAGVRRLMRSATEFASPEHPQHHQYLLRKAELLRRGRRNEAAMHALEELRHEPLVIGGQGSVVWLEWALLRTRTSRFDAAQQAIQRAHHLLDDSDHPYYRMEAWDRQARLCIATGDSTGAAEALRRGRKLQAQMGILAPGLDEIAQCLTRASS